MIDIKKLSKKDKERYVFYTDKNKPKEKQEELGFITSWNDKFIFVNYDKSNESGIATNPKDLRFLTENEEDDLPEYLNALQEAEYDEEE